MPPRLTTIVQKLGRLGVAFFFLLALYVLLYFAAPSSGFTGFAGLVLYVTGAIYAVRLIRRSVKRAIWWLRNRLIVAYLFIAVVPVVLIATLVAIGGYFLVGQAAVYLVGAELDRRTATLNNTAQLIADAPPGKREALARQVSSFLQTRFQNLELLVRADRDYRYPEGASVAAPPEGWKDASGIVVRDRRFYSWAHAVKPGVEVTFLAPLTADSLADLVPNLGEVFLGSFIDRGAAAPAARPKGTVRQRMGDPDLVAPARGEAKKGRNYMPQATSRFDVAVNWPTPMTVSSWDAPGKTQGAFLLVSTRPSAVLGIIFSRVEVSQTVLTVFLVVAGLLLAVELVSLVIGVNMTRTITRAVHTLYEGTARVKEGDFSHRIEVHGNDQLADLGTSFNRMTENLERLILVEKEQERLKSEIEIAREVQGQLFPRGAPTMKTLELTGVCHPARMVSGDYYDFVRLQDSRVALAIGDVAGKGISAALLMAALQSMMRTQLTAGIPVQAMAAQSGGNGGAHSLLSAATLVGQLNRQVYATTAPEKYATFYFGLYDDDNRVLTYTNAGHLPPILMRNGVAQRLEVTGTVVGAFPSVLYGEKSIELRQGDLLVAFTDGIVEPENEYGEAFGEEQLIDLLAQHGELESKEIIARVMETVEQWTGTTELFDDMTLLLARGV